MELPLLAQGKVCLNKERIKSLNWTSSIWKTGAEHFKLQERRKCFCGEKISALVNVSEIKSNIQQYSEALL